MDAVSKELYALISELQQFPFLSEFSLGGGTNLALRYNHRISNDIDLFTDQIIGRAGLEKIRNNLIEVYQGDMIFCELLDADLEEQYCFLRALIRKDKSNIKVEFLQNMKIVDEIEVYNGIRLFTKKDIALFKLMSASNRKALKDIYDLDIITDEIPLDKLLDDLAKKLDKYNLPEHQSLFDLDRGKIPTENPGALLEYDNINYETIPSRPSHSNDVIKIVPPGKELSVAKRSWKKKVRELLRSKGIDLPPVQPIN